MHPRTWDTAWAQIADRPPDRRYANWRRVRPGTRSSCVRACSRSWPPRQPQETIRSMIGPQHGARGRQVFRRIHAERNTPDDHDIDTHAGFERPQLLKFLTLLKGRRRQLHEPRERTAPIGIKPN